MIDFLKNMLTKIELSNTDMVHFETGSSFNAIYVKERKLYNVFITLDEPLPANVYVSTLDAFNRYFKKVDQETIIALYIKLTKKCMDSKIVKDYITYYVDCKEKNKEDFEFLKDQAMNIRNNYVQITYKSSLLEDYLNTVKLRLDRFLAAAGFDYLKVSFNYEEPEDTIFEGGYFKAILTFPQDFPQNPPEMKFITEMWHPNIYKDGKVCISILHSPGVDQFNEQEKAEERRQPSEEGGRTF